MILSMAKLTDSARSCNPTDDYPGARFRISYREGALKMSTAHTPAWKLAARIAKKEISPLEVMRDTL